jgi:hypothetical protein
VLFGANFPRGGGVPFKLHHIKVCIRSLGVDEFDDTEMEGSCVHSSSLNPSSTKKLAPNTIVLSVPTQRAVGRLLSILQS